eukprot:gene28060-31162_t
MSCRHVVRFCKKARAGSVAESRKVSAKTVTWDYESEGNEGKRTIVSKRFTSSDSHPLIHTRGSIRCPKAVAKVALAGCAKARHGCGASNECPVDEPGSVLPKKDKASDLSRVQTQSSSAPAKLASERLAFPAKLTSERLAFPAKLASERAVPPAKPASERVASTATVASERVASECWSHLIAEGVSQVAGIADDAPFGIGPVCKDLKKPLDTAKHVKHNRSQCTTILTDMGIVVGIMTKLEKQKKKDDALERAMGQLKPVVEKTQCLFQGWSEQGQAQQAVSAERKATMIADVTNAIDSAKAALTLCLAVPSAQRHTVPGSTGSKLHQSDAAAIIAHYGAGGRPPR